MRPFENNLERRAAAKIALTTADADSKLRRALGRRYQGQNKEFKLGERVWFWRDARQGLLNKIRWLGPAHVIMREEYPDSRKPTIKTYWLAYKTQLIRAAPHHVRGDILGPERVIDDLQKSLNMVRQLKSRGVTRWYDLQRVNRQRLDDVDEDEQIDDPGGPLDEDEVAPPPAHRLHLHPPTEGVEPMVDIPADDYSPTSPAHSGYAPTSPTGLMAPPLVEQEQTMAVPPEENAAQIPVPLSLPTSPASTFQITTSEPAVPTPHHGEQPSAELDPETAALYEPVDGESFQERRNRFNRQTISFGPWRHQGRRDSTPYETADHPRTLSSSEPLSSPQAEQDRDAALLSQAFTISEITANCLPKGWNFEDGYFQLDKRPMDHWEVKAGCLIRHHVVLRRQKMSLQHLPRDSPFPAEELDNARVTVVYDTNGRCR